MSLPLMRVMMFASLSIVPPLQTKIVSVTESLSAHLRSWFSIRTHKPLLPLSS